MEQESLLCLLCPVKDFNLLLPCSAVAEVVQKAEVEYSDSVDPRFLGTMQWHNTSLEIFSLQVRQQAIKKAAAVVLRRLIVAEQHYYALQLTAIPRVVRVRGCDLQLTTRSDAEPWVMHHLRLAGEEAVIADMRVLEQQLLADVTAVRQH